MKRHMNFQRLVLSMGMGIVFLMPVLGEADTLSKGQSKLGGVVTADHGGILTGSSLAFS